ncbi:protein Aster-B [Patella vulgata]|uniref:protein Aster-B n=1 Tax=Patella vulgata TaxID=6465 RepID=UPI0024A8F8C3|nr:protein Aster-B [Patella vulgata]
MSLPVSKDQRRSVLEVSRFSSSSSPEIDKTQTTTSLFASTTTLKESKSLSNVGSGGSWGKSSSPTAASNSEGSPLLLLRQSHRRSRDSAMSSSQESINTVGLNKDGHHGSAGDLDDVESELKCSNKQSETTIQEVEESHSSSPDVDQFASASDLIEAAEDKETTPDTSAIENQDVSSKPYSKSDSLDQSSDKSEGQQTRERSFERSLDNIMDKCSEKSLDLNLSVDSWNGSVSDTSVRTPDLSNSSYGTKCSKIEKKRKAKSWYTMLSPTYKSRSEDFHKLFKDVPKDDRLVVDYSCALQKDILVQGRMYLSQNWICFYANIFRWETVLTIPCSEIVAITKEKTARVIPNAIQVTTEKEKYFFTSFGARDKTYMMLFRLWQNALLSEPMNPKEQWQWIHYSYGEELGLTSSDEDYVAPPGMDDLKEKLLPPEMPPLKEQTDSSDIHGTSEMLTMASNDEDAIQSDEVFSHPQTSPSLDSPLSLGRSEIPTDFSDTTEDSEGEVACSGHDHLEKLYVDEVFNISVDKMFTLLFTDTPFFRIFVESRKTFDVEIPNWGEEVDEDGNRVRTISYTLSLNHSIGPKTSPSTERQTCYKQSKPGIIYVVDCQCENNGIPYADSFFVITQYCLTRVTKDKCRLRVTGEVKYKKSVMGLIKSMIERSAVGGLTDYFRDLAVHLRREVEESDKLLVHTISKKKLRKRRKGGTTGSETQTSSRQADRQVSTPPSPLKSLRDDRLLWISSDALVRIICLILTLLVVFNAILFYKLWSLESFAGAFYQSHSDQILENLAKYPHSQDEWVHLLRQQQNLHDSEIDKWRDVLSTSIILVDQIKGTLVHLHSSLEGRLKNTDSSS